MKQEQIIEAGMRTINGKQIYIEFQKVDVNRPTIVFLHDSLGCVQLWRDFPQQLGELTNCNVLIYDRFGYGKSQAMLTDERPNNYLELETDFFNYLLNVLKIKNVIVFGHSDGGTIALLAASKYSQNIKAVICEAGHIFVEDITLQGIYATIENAKANKLFDRLEKYHGNKVDTIFKAWYKTWTRSDYRDWNIEHFLHAITCPLLFIQGEADEYATLKQVENTINQVKGKAETFIIPGIGHAPHKESPEQVLAKTAEFIHQLP